MAKIFNLKENHTHPKSQSLGATAPACRPETPVAGITWAFFLKRTVFCNCPEEEGCSGLPARVGVEPEAGLHVSRRAVPFSTFFTRDDRWCRNSRERPVRNGTAPWCWCRAVEVRVFYLSVVKKKYRLQPTATLLLVDTISVSMNERDDVRAIKLVPCSML